MLSTPLIPSTSALNLFFLFIKRVWILCVCVDMRFFFVRLSFIALIRSYMREKNFFMFRLVFWINETCFYNILDRVFYYAILLSTLNHYIFVTFYNAFHLILASTSIIIEFLNCPHLMCLTVFYQPILLHYSFCIWIHRYQCAK